MSDDFSAALGRIRAAMAAKPNAVPDIEPERLAAILDGTRRPSTYDLALISEACGVSVTKLLTGDELADVRQILEVAADPTCWLVESPRGSDIAFSRHQAMAAALSALLKRHQPGAPRPTYEPCSTHRGWRPGHANHETCKDCRRLPDRYYCAGCGHNWPCQDVTTITKRLDPDAFAGAFAGQKREVPE